ncbi:WAP four-disulfide core domain 1 [Elysia marginata]|uniref:WAP four-disulfide core domain protein 1 n=1 Tax=Elysia marginata TaxID=1093978 RepID=A0AAV4JTG4_9GAST|nr:WAP four-disulfide core domain 1 [Elysia marginata]
MIANQHVSHNFRLWRTSSPACRLLSRALLVWSMTLVAAAAAPLTADLDGADDSQDLDYPRNRWLADGTFYDVDQLQDDNLKVADLDSELCPRVPKELPVGSCDAKECNSDDECTGRQSKCCYNGCVYTCLAEVHRPVHIDWIHEPRRRLQFGPSWLIPGPDDNSDVEMCTTTHLKDNDDDDDADPLVCPHGYECSIDDPGKPEVGIPNRGHCVKVIDVRGVTDTVKSLPSPRIDQNLQADAPYADYVPTKNCPLGYDGLVLLSGHSITQNGRECVCKEAELNCDIKAEPVS